MYTKKSIDIIERCILGLNQPCYGGVPVSVEQASERAITAVTVLNFENTDLSQFKEQFDKAGVKFSINCVDKWTVITPQRVACGFKFNEFGEFIDLLVL